MFHYSLIFSNCHYAFIQKTFKITKQVKFLVILSLISSNCNFYQKAAIGYAVFAVYY